MFAFTLTAIRVVNVLNWIFAALFTLLFAMMLAVPDLFYKHVADAFDMAPGASNAAYYWLLATVGLAVPIAILVHMILTRLAALVSSARSANALTDENAQRLTTIAWCLLAINLIDLPFGYLSMWASEVSGEYFGWSPSLTAWLAALMLFVLARVFRHGAQMRADLEGTI